MTLNYTPNMTAEEAKANAEEEIKNLHKRMLIVEGAEKAAISDLISEIKRQLEDYCRQLSN